MLMFHFQKYGVAENGVLVVKLMYGKVGRLHGNWSSRMLPRVESQWVKCWCNEKCLIKAAWTEAGVSFLKDPSTILYTFAP